jgi:EmrB/QacA subfamily drug resistance transporter
VRARAELRSRTSEETVEARHSKGPDTGMQSAELQSAELQSAGPASAPGISAPGISAGGYGRASLALILTAVFMVVLDFSIVNVALASIERELHFDASSVQWVVTGYAITFGGLLVLGGRAADLYGRRRLFRSGMLVFTLASLAGGLAQDPVLLVTARLVQGAGAAMVAPAALSLITTGFAEGQARARALGAYGAVASVGFVAGQVLGGVLVQVISWRAVFLVNVPVGLVAVVLAPRLLRESRFAGHQRRLDVSGALLITVSIALLVLAVSEAAMNGLLSPVVLAAFALAAVTATAFVWVEHRHSDPLVPLRLLRLRGLQSASVMMVLVGLWNGGELLVLSLYLQQVLHDSPLVSGLVIAPQGVIGFTAGFFGARLMRRLGLQRLTLLTGVSAMVGFLLLTQLPATGGYNPVLAAVTLVGFGTAGAAYTSMISATNGMADSDQGFVGGAINTSRQIGAAIGAALLPAIALAVDHGHGGADVSGDRAAMLAGAVVAGLAVLVALRLRMAPRTRANVERERPTAPVELCAACD